MIALVVTIVVLLILAGVTISYVLANDGIFGKAEESKIHATRGLISDYASNAQATYLVLSYQENVSTAELATTQAQQAVSGAFPTGYTVTTTSIAAAANGHVITGTATVTVDAISGYTFTITYTNGVPAVTFASNS